MIEVGEYVRYNGIITKAIDKVGLYSFELDNGTFYDPRDITYEGIKHSKNIIDLIEIGDIVECFVGKGLEGEDTTKYEVSAIEVTDMNGNKLNEIGICGEEGTEFMPFENVRTILTKELFEANCYKVKEE